MTQSSSNHMLKLSLAVQDDELMLAESPREDSEMQTSQVEKLYFVTLRQKGQVPAFDLNAPQAAEKCRFAYELMSNVVSQMCKAHRRQ